MPYVVFPQIEFRQYTAVAKVLERSVSDHRARQLAQREDVLFLVDFSCPHPWGVCSRTYLILLTDSDRTSTLGILCSAGQRKAAGRRQRGAPEGQNARDQSPSATAVPPKSLAAGSGRARPARFRAGRPRAHVSHAHAACPKQRHGHRPPGVVLTASMETSLRSEPHKFRLRTVARSSLRVFCSTSSSVKTTMRILADHHLPLHW